MKETPSNCTSGKIVPDGKGGWYYDIDITDSTEARLFAADVVKVVRCEKCRFSEEIDPRLYICHNENIIIIGDYVDPEWFCGDGRRKDNEG